MSGTSKFTKKDVFFSENKSLALYHKLKMKNLSQLKRVSAISFLMIFLSTSSFAVNIQQYYRSNTLTYEILEDARMKNSHVYNDYDMVFTLGGSWVESPLVQKNNANSTQLDTIISDMTAVHFGVSAYLTRSFMLGLNSSYAWFKNVQQGNPTGQGNFSGFTDLNLNATWRFYTQERWALAVAPNLTLPLGSGGETDINVQNPPAGSSNPVKTNVLSDEGIGFGGSLIFEYLFDSFNMTVNLGYKHNSSAEFDELKYTQRLLTGIGAYIPMSRKWGFNVEWLRQWTLPFNRNQNPNEIFIGTSFGISKYFAGYAGVGLGNQLESFDGNDLRLSAGIKFTPRIWSKERRPIEIISQEKTECTPPYVFNDVSNVSILLYPNDVGDIWLEEKVQPVADAINKRISDIRKIIVSGHTSSPASNDYNIDLSKRRAATAIASLTKLGVPKSFIISEAYGENLLDDKSGTVEAQVKNRRTVIKVLLKDKANYYCPVQ